MQRLWLIFAQTATIAMAVLFVVSILFSLRHLKCNTITVTAMGRNAGDRK